MTPLKSIRLRSLRMIVPVVGAIIAQGLLADAGRADPPAGLFEATEEAFALCAERGGTARILDGYERNRDLNGDGLADYITDQGRIACGDIEAALCDPEGCALIVWLSAPDGAYGRVELGTALDYELLPPPAGVGLPRLRSIHAGPVCAAAGLDAAICSQTWSFAGEAPQSTDLVPPPPLRPEARPPAGERPGLPVAPGWSLRRTEDGSPVALGGGVGDLRSLGAFCLQDHPFLVLRFVEAPAAQEIALSFDFSTGSVEAVALREDSAGGGYIVDLAPSRLAAFLAGADSSVDVTIDRSEPRSISLGGSTATIRSALGPCYDF
jgi:hypothetical protein